MPKRYFGALALGLSALFGSVSMAQAQSAQHPGWLPWHGCWRADAAPASELLCIVPDGVGVRMVTLSDGAIVGDSRVVTDARPHSVRQDGCEGTEQARWSLDGQRVFLTSELNCQGGVSRRVTGILSITGLTEWVSAQAVTIDDKTATRSVRYTAVESSNVPSNILNALNVTSRSARIAAREIAMVPLDEGDVNEAINAVDTPTVQEWLVATGEQFALEDNIPDDDIPSASALELVGGVARAEPYTTERVVERVVERPTYVHHTTYVHTVRSCWDPFFSGWVSLGWGVGVGVTYSDCAPYYYRRYSPWGYDLHGWHVVHRPIVIVRGGPRIVRPIIIRGGHRGRDWDRDWRGGNWDRDHDRDRSNGGRATRGGYVSGTRAVERSSSTPQGQRERLSPNVRNQPTRVTTGRTAAPRVVPSDRAPSSSRANASASRSSAASDRWSTRPEPRASGSARASMGGYRSASPRVSTEGYGGGSSSARSPRVASSSSGSSPRVYGGSNSSPRVSSGSGGSSRAASARSSGGYSSRASSSASSSARSSSSSARSSSGGGSSRSARPRN
jgi:hypothetical protein